MKRLFISGSLLVAVICGLVFLWAKSGGQAPAALAGDRASGEAADKPPAPGEPGYAEYSDRQQLVDNLFDWKQPIEFYGKVIDDNGQPIPEVRVRFIWNDLSEEGTSEASTISNEDGLFSLANVRGKGLSVRLEKEGYDVSHRQNQFGFEYANAHEPHFHVPDSERPVVFHLRKKGPAEPLLVLDKGYRVPKDGTPVEVNLTTGRQVPAGQGHIRVECWTYDQEKDAFKRYTWRCRISVPGGGIISSTNEFDYLAPAAGYVESDLIEMRPDMGRDWTKDVKRSYFMHLRDGTYGRAKFRMIASGDHFFVVDSAVNPSGSRNLEPGLEERVLK